MAVNERAKTTVYLDGKQAEAAIDALGNKAKELRRDLKEAQKAGDNIKMKGLERELKRVEAAQRSLKKETFDVERVLKDINKVSWRDLEKAQKTVRAQMKGLERDTDAYTKKKKDLELITSELNKARGVMKQKQTLWNRLSDGANRYATIAAGILATVTGIAFSMREWVKGLVGLDDAIADVMKTTGLARKQVREMYQDFRSLNTRTPRRELLLLAEEAGRLGKKSRRDVMDFIEVANQIKVALGDDLGGEAEVAIREVGKLTDIYRVGSQYGTDFKESMLKVGSAINEVSANSNAQAPFLIGYLKRMGGIANQTGMTTAETLGYASALDQLGQSQEMAATAHGKVLIDMYKDHSKYAEIARMSADDFLNLLNTDANEAFLKLLEGLNGNNQGMLLMAQRLDALDIDGSRAVQVLAALASNTDKVRQEQKLANKAMEDGISLTNEYNVKNNNLAGSWEKIGQYIHSKFINSNFLGWLEKVIGKVGEWVEVPLSETLQKEKGELNLLVASITNVNNTQETRNSLISELQEKYPDFLENLDSEKVTNEELRDRLREVNQEYENRILLAIKEEALQENYKKRLQLKLDELDAIKQMAKYEEIAQKAREKVGQERDPNKLRALLSDEEITALNAMDLVPKRLQNIRDQFGELIDQENELNKAVDVLRSKMPGQTGGGGNGGRYPKPSGSAFQIEDAQDEELGLEKWMTDDKFWGSDRDKALQEAKMQREREFTKFLEQQFDDREKAYIDDVKNKEKAQNAFENVRDAEINSYVMIANAMAGLADQSTAFGKITFAAQKALAIAQIWLNLPKEISGIVTAASFLPPIAREAYITKSIAGAKTRATVNTAIVAATALKGLGSKKTGGFGETGLNDDEVAGFYHRNEWIANAPAVRKNKPFFNWLNQLQESGALSQIDLTPVVSSVSITGRKSGGYSSPSSSASSASTPAQAYAGAGISAESIDKFDKAIERLEKIDLILSVKEVSDLLEKRKLRDRQSSLQ